MLAFKLPAAPVLWAGAERVDEGAEVPLGRSELGTERGLEGWMMEEFWAGTPVERMTDETLVTMEDEVPLTEELTTGLETG